jgi:hypothetical protein
MKKKAIFLMLTLIMMSVASVKAQVTIGSLNDPHKGAVLDLSQVGGDVGVLFPRVYISSTASFKLAVDDRVDAKGMVVYNINSELPDGVGLYAWNGSEWKSMGVGDTACAPVTATATSEKTAGNNAKITVNVTSGDPTFSYIWTKNGNIVWVTVNTNATSDNYTTTGAGAYVVTVTNPCTVAAESFTFVVDGNGGTLTDNGNGTFTNEGGQLVYDDKIYTPVESDISGIYLDEDGEIVYTGRDGIPGTPDDNVFTGTGGRPLPLQKTLFSIKYPIVVLQEGEYQIELDFADGLAYDGKIKYLSGSPDRITVNENGRMIVGPTSNVSTSIAIILEDGSIITSSFNVRSKIIGSGNKLAGVINAEATLAEGLTRKIEVGRRATDGSGNAYNASTLIYTMADDGDTGSTVTSGGWFHAGSPGVATVTATATDDEEHEFTGTVTVTILGESPAETLPYEAASTGWAALNPAPAYAGGDGTATSPYQISSVRQFKKLAVDIALLGSADATYRKYFELTTDLDFSADNTVTSTLIGVFFGTFDGKGHVIKDLNIDATGKSYVSPFRSLFYGEIKNLGREGGSTTGNNASVVSGLVGEISSGKLSNCYNSSSINVNQTVGGLVANLGSGGVTIQNCYNTGEIVSSGYQNGGLVATCLYSGGSVSIINSYNAGIVSGSSANGGITGNINYSQGNKQTLNLNNSFNFGNITNKNNDNNVGSFIAYFIETNSNLVNVNTTNAYSRPDVASANNGADPKSNQPIGWSNTAQESLKNAILLANPTLGENEKYSLEYSQSPAFATELGNAFKHAQGRTPKLAWEK